MKILLICPNQAAGIPALAEANPPMTLPLLGERFICSWMRHLAGKGVKEVRILANEAASQIEVAVGDGSRWGMKVEVRHEARDLTPAEARARHQEGDEADWAQAIEADHLPGLDGHKVFEGYAAFFKGLELWLPRAIASQPIGLKEVLPGVWVGRKAHLARTAVLRGPCYIGDNARIGRSAVVGPMSYLEERVVLDQHCETGRSWIAPNTFVGALTQVKDSLAWGDLLINWRTDSATVVPDSFLLASLTGGKRPDGRNEKAQPAKARLPQPFAPVISLVQKAQS